MWSINGLIPFLLQTRMKKGTNISTLDSSWMNSLRVVLHLVKVWNCAQSGIDLLHSRAQSFSGQCWPERSYLLCTSVKSQGLLGFGEKLMLKMIFFHQILGGEGASSSVSDGWIVSNSDSMIQVLGLCGFSRHFHPWTISHTCVCPSVLFTHTGPANSFSSPWTLLLTDPSPPQAPVSCLAKEDNGL